MPNINEKLKKFEPLAVILLAVIIGAVYPSGFHPAQ